MRFLKELYLKTDNAGFFEPLRNLYRARCRL